jgi:DNA-binding MarR family transcriptional regulator
MPLSLSSPKSKPTKPAADADLAVDVLDTVDTVDTVDTRYLEGLMGYNARRASLAIIGRFMKEMVVYGLRPVDFSVLSLINHNPGITSRQLCAALGLLPPNLVGMINLFEKRALITRRAHPSDGRALALHASEKGQKLMHEAEATAQRLEVAATAHLTPAETKTLIRLLKKIYL